MNPALTKMFDGKGHAALVAPILVRISGVARPVHQALGVHVSLKWKENGLMPPV